MAIDSAPEFDADAIESAILDAISTKYMCTRGRCKRMSRVMMKMSTDGLNPMMWKISVPVQNRHSEFPRRLGDLPVRYAT